MLAGSKTKPRSGAGAAAKGISTDFFKKSLPRVSPNRAASVCKTMKVRQEGRFVETDRFYKEIIQKLNTTIATFKHLTDIARCGERFEVLEQAAYSRDAQINHLLSITNCLLKYLPNSPALEQVFTNFLKDYIHLVNPEMPGFVGDLYLEAPYLGGQDNPKEDHPYRQQT
jgi:hypothetical protein